MSNNNTDTGFRSMHAAVSKFFDKKGEGAEKIVLHTWDGTGYEERNLFRREGYRLKAEEVIECHSAFGGDWVETVLQRL
jgi:hypothetical protein